jgi:hypothetical protein
LPENFLTRLIQPTQKAARLISNVSATEITMLNKYVIVLLVTFCACTSFAEKNNDIPIVTNQSDLDLYIGKVITIRGKVTNTKIPTIIGVDVRSEDPDLRGFKNLGDVHK